MKARIKASNDLWFEAEAETEEKLFKQVARVQEIFQLFLEIYRKLLCVFHPG